MDIEFEENAVEFEMEMETGIIENDHSHLINRDLPNQHPMRAIEGLEEALTPIQGADIDIIVEGE